MGSITVIGAGNVGQAMSGHMTLLGHDVRLFSPWESDFVDIRTLGGVRLTGEVEGTATPAVITSDLNRAVAGAEIVVVAVPAFAHASLSEQLAKVVQPHQLVLFQPSVLGSGVELSRHFRRACRTPCLIAETATSLYTCRLRGPAQVFIGAIKNIVHLATVPSASVGTAAERLSEYFGDRYASSHDTLSVGLANCNAIYHVPPALLNFKTVEDSVRLPLHSLVTPRIAQVIHELDQERLALAQALDVDTISFWAFLESAYGVTGGTYVERIVQGYGRQAFPEPDSITHRYFTEDIPFGMVTWSSLARQVGLSLPLNDSLIGLSGVLCGRDWFAEGRTADTLGLGRADAAGIRAAFRDGATR